MQNKRRKILIHSLIFSPDCVSTAYLYNDIALAFKDSGYDVIVLTTTPHFNSVDSVQKKQPLHWKFWGLLKQSVFNGINVYHVPQKKFKSTALRLVGFVYWHIVSFFIGLGIRNVDVILSPSPPLTIGVINAILGYIKGAKVVYNVQEIYPDILDLKDGVVKRALEKMERYVYKHSDKVITIDRVFYDQIVDRMDREGKLQIIPNFVDNELYRPIDPNDISLPEDLFPRTGSLKVLYAGNIGFAQDWETLIQLAIATKDSDVEYIVIGEGVRKAYLENAIKVKRINNVRVLPYQQRELMPEIIAYSDLQFIFMSQSMEKQGFPSKVYTIMSCGKPMMVCSGLGTPIINFLEDKSCALLVPERCLDEKVNKMAGWLRTVNRETLKEMGANGRQIIMQSYTKDVVAMQYVNMIEELI